MSFNDPKPNIAKNDKSGADTSVRATQDLRAPVAATQSVKRSVQRNAQACQALFTQPGLNEINLRRLRPEAAAMGNGDDGYISVWLSRALPRPAPKKARH